MHGDGDGKNPAETAGFPRGWILFGGDPTGMVDKFGCEKVWSAYSIYQLYFTKTGRDKKTIKQIKKSLTRKNLTMSLCLDRPLLWGYFQYKLPVLPLR